MKVSTLFIGLSLLSASLLSTNAPAEPVTLFVRVRAQDHTPLERIIDDLTVEFVNYYEAHEERSHLIRPTGEGYFISARSVIDLSSVSEEMRPRVISKLRSIFVEGERWRGKTFRYAERHVGISSDATESMRQYESAVENAQLAGPLDVEDICDFWLTKLN